MIIGYLFMTYVAVISCWPVSLILLLAVAAILLHLDRRILRVSIIAFVGFLAFCGLAVRNESAQYTYFSLRWRCMAIWGNSCRE